MSYPTYEVTKATLDNTTNLIQTLQAKKREYMRDDYRTRVWALHIVVLMMIYSLMLFFNLYAQLKDTNFCNFFHLNIQHLKESIS